MILRVGSCVRSQKDERVSQRAVEALLGRLVCDDSFRREFYKDPAVAVTRLGFQVTPVELSSLQSIKLRVVEKLADKLDDRIRRAHGPLKG